MSRFIDIHILQSVPPSNMNRDDTGSPKTATFGGVSRARVSSQAWKRATRAAFGVHLDQSELGYRTARVIELIADRIVSMDASIEPATAQDWAKKVTDAVGLKTKAPRKKDGEDAGPDQSGYLVFLSDHQVERLAQLALDGAGESIDKKAAKEAMKAENSIDVALFGRMVADDATLNVDAAVQVAHAISTHAVKNEYDYYTAVDDKNPREETGAGMIGTIEFNSATLYRYATINVDMLVSNLGDDEAAARAATAFVESFVTSMPTGKQNTFANRTLPEAIVVQVRQGQPISYVGAFESAIRPDGGLAAASASRLTTYADGIGTAYGNVPEEAYVVALPHVSDSLAGLGQQVAFPELLTKVSLVAGGGASS